MNKISTILAVVAIALAASFYVIQNKQIRELKAEAGAVKKPTAGVNFRIAYFDLDSLQAHYDGFKEAQDQARTKENDMSMTLTRMDRDNQKKIEAWRQKGNTMTQAEGEQAQREYADMQQRFAATKQQLEQDQYKFTEELRSKIRKNIEDFLKKYNKERNYSYIFAYDPNSFVYGKDSAYDITSEIVNGLNSEYKKK
ncbi:OmpH family outer membrane protein [Puia sp. P3]|uniref:OmpH family outer membrane protein n=1 Tax=Puia sp. P3 TaxID=3423952 RepID=UPI003D66CF2C